MEIRTQRLSLTRLDRDDANSLYAYRSDPAVSRYQCWVPGSLDEVAEFIKDQQSTSFDTPGTWYQFAIRFRDAGLLVGDLGVRFPKEDTRQVELGITIDPRHQRQGYGVEAVKGVLDHLLGRLGKHRVFASVDPQNEAAIALLERVGMRQEAHFRESLWMKDEWADDIVYAVLKSEWNGA